MNEGPFETLWVAYDVRWHVAIPHRAVGPHVPDSQDWGSSKVFRSAQRSLPPEAPSLAAWFKWSGVVLVSQAACTCIV